MSEPVIDTSDAAHLASVLSPRRTYARMAAVGAVGICALSLLAWAMSSTQKRQLEGRGFDLLAMSRGTVAEVYLREGQSFQKGDVLVTLDDSAEQAELASARAELEKIAQENQTAGIAVALPPSLSGLGGRIVTTGPLQPKGPEPRTDAQLGTLPPVTGAGGTAAEPTLSESPVLGLRIAELDTKVAGLRTEAVKRKAKIDELNATVSEAQKNADAAKVIAEQRSRQAERMRDLLKEGVVSQVETSRAEALYASSQGGYQAAVKLVDEQVALVDAEVSAGKADDALITELERELKSTREAAEKVAKVSSTPVRSPAPIASPEPSRVSKPAFVKSEPAPAVPAKVEVDTGAKREADARFQSAKDRYDRAEAAIQDRRIIANRSGKVTKVLVKVGDTITPGTSLALVRFDDPQTGQVGRTGSPGG